MLNITGMNRFYYIRDFRDMCCKYSRILAVIRHQLGREPQKDEVFIVMSKSRGLVRLFSFDRISFSLYEKRFAPEYQFMKVVREGDQYQSDVEAAPVPKDSRNSSAIGQTFNIANRPETYKSMGANGRKIVHKSDRSR